MVLEDDVFSRAVIEEFISKTEGLRLVKSEKSIGNCNVLFLSLGERQSYDVELFDTYNKDFAIVAMSSDKRHVRGAFNMQFVDFIHKPISSYNRFLVSIDKARATLVARLPGEACLPREAGYDDLVKGSMILKKQGTL